MKQVSQLEERKKPTCLVFVGLGFDTIIVV
jgi:hypothetical protein